MNKNINLKKIGLIITIIASIIIVLFNISISVYGTSYYGNSSYWFKLVCIDIFSLSFAYYLCAKNNTFNLSSKFNPSSLFSLRSVYKGPMFGLLYIGYSSMYRNIGILYISLAIGYILVLIHNINEFKQAKINAEQKDII